MTESRRLLNLAAPFIGAVLALIAAAMLSGCSTIRDAVDEYRAWRDRQTNAPAVPPNAPPATPGTPTWRARKG